jgi:hypothetical protein
MRSGSAIASGGRGAEVLARLPPDLAEEGALRGIARGEVFGGLRAGEEVQALLGAGGGDVEEAAGLDVVGVLVELAHILVCRVFAGAGLVDGREEEAPSARDFQTRSGFGPERGRRSRPGTMTVSNSRPLARWMVMISTASSGASTSGSA